MTSQIGHGPRRLDLNLKFKCVLLCADLFFITRSRDKVSGSLAQRAVVPSPAGESFF